MATRNNSIVIDNLQRLISKLCLSCQCHFVLIGHIEPERDETTGRVVNMVSTLGRKLAPKIPNNFSDVILSKRSGSQFTWSTADGGTDLKARNLPISENITPSFAIPVSNWAARQKEAKEVR